MERTIGNLGQEIKLHSDPYANLSERGVRRAQMNALKAILPELEPDKAALPRGSHGKVTHDLRGNFLRNHVLDIVRDG